MFLDVENKGSCGQANYPRRIASSALFKTHLCYYATSIAKVRVTSGSILLEITRKCKMTNREEVYSYTVVARCVYRQDPSTSDDCRRACN